MEISNELVVNKISAYGKAHLPFHGDLLENIDDFSYKFNGGNIYALIDEFGNGSALLSYLLSGEKPHRKMRLAGEIIVNGKTISRNTSLKKYSWYAGCTTIKNKFISFKNISIRKHIEYGIKSHLSFSSDIADIKRLFNLSNERFDRPIQYVSGERWKASLAIGYSLGKIIYCFPWLNSGELELLRENITPALSALLDVNAIVIIPTPSEKYIRRIPLKTIYINFDVNRYNPNDCGEY